MKNLTSRTAVPRQRIGVFGGTFDPPHIGHLVAASVARSFLHLDEVLFPVANIPWMKTAHSMTAPEVRYEMLCAMLHGLEGFTPTHIEIERKGETYTIDTVRELREQQPDAEIYLVVGADVAATLHAWREAEELAQLVTVAIAARPGAVVPQMEDSWQVVELPMPRLDISSSELRERVRNGFSVEFLVRETVAAIISRECLYR